VEELKAVFNRELPEGFEVTTIKLDPGRHELRLLTCYHVKFNGPVKIEIIDTFLACDKMEIEVVRKGRPRKVDARPLVASLGLAEGDNRIEMQLLTEAGMAALKPLEIVATLFGLSDEEAVLTRIMKMWCRET
jgi:hypothetical protein